MTFETIDLIFNVILFLFWIRIWGRQDRLAFFNPYILALGRLPLAAINMLQPAFRRLPERVVAILIFVLLIVLRALAGPQDTGLWHITMGFASMSLPPEAGPGSYVLFSLLSFAAFLFRVWGLSILYLAFASIPPAQQTGAALHFMSMPFTRINQTWRPAVLLGVGMVIGLLAVIGLHTAITVIGVRASGPLIAGDLSSRTFVQTFLMACSGWTDILLVMQQFMIIFIIGSIISMLTGSGSVSFLCREWIDFLLGPLRNYPLRIGMFDLTPWIFIFLVFYAHGFLNAMLLRSFYRLL